MCSRTGACDSTPKDQLQFHRRSYFIQQIEIEANTFAAELLLPDDIEREYPGMTVDQIAAQLGVVPELIKLKY